MSASNSVSAAARDAAAVAPATLAAAQTRLELLRRLRPKAPPLPLPVAGAGCRHIPVSDANAFAAAVQQAQPGDVILLADGVYSLPLDIALLTDHVQIRGAAQDPAKVILDGSRLHMDIDTALVRVKRARHVTFADLTFQNSRKYGLLFYGDASVHHLHVYNCRFRNCWARGLKGTHPARPEDNPVYGTNPPEVIELVRPKHGRVEYCEFSADHRKIDRTDGFDGDYIAGMDLMSVADWIFAHNLFFNLQGANGVGRGAIFLWIDSRDVLIEHNLFVDCDRAIALGNPSQVQFLNMDRAVVRHNTIVNGAGHGIECHSTRDIHLYANRIFATQNRCAVIEWRYGSLGGRLENNHIHGPLDLEKEVHQFTNELDPNPIPQPDDRTLIERLNP